MSKYIVYCLNTNNNQLDIISIEEDEKVAKNIQNSYSFNLLCDLNKNKSLYKLEINQNIIQIIEININIKNGWISNTIVENKQSIYETGIINYFKKEYLNLDINESYVPKNNKNDSSPSLPKNSPNMIPNMIPNILPNSLKNKKPEESKNKTNISMLLLEELKRKCKVKD